ncbi:hypothetical protein DRO24_03015, partial [Candidatus Bathyarchaeota archaeon]
THHPLTNQNTLTLLIGESRFIFLIRLAEFPSSNRHSSPLGALNPPKAVAPRPEDPWPTLHRPGVRIIATARLRP